jgi:hypothetical protein
MCLVSNLCGGRFHRDNDVIAYEPVHLIQQGRIFGFVAARSLLTPPSSPAREVGVRTLNRMTSIPNVHYASPVDCTQSIRPKALRWNRSR